ncbi:hypothetical protein AX17_006628 [Amanita inopinata Kibby_2008]|nr:hypothetical protein AX17_006628 [Amanita inopinata Kibby_2008]
MSAENKASSSTSTTPSNPASNWHYEISPLENNGSNFQTWKFRLKTILELRGFFDVVKGEAKMPEDMKSGDYLKWAQRDMEVQAQIILSLKDEPLSGVIHTTTAKEVWDKLSEHCEGKGQQSMAYLIGELFRNTLSDESPMESQLNAMRQKSHILASLSLKLEDPLIAIVMIISLPESYSTLRTILMSAEDKLSPEKVIAQVLVEEKNQSNPSLQVALLAKVKGKAPVRDKEDER